MEETLMSWAAHIRRVPPDWDYENYDWHVGHPEWPTEERTYLQWWQSKTDPTPISPPFATHEEMAKYAISNSHWPYFAHFSDDDVESAIHYVTAIAGDDLAK